MTPNRFASEFGRTFAYVGERIVHDSADGFRVVAWIDVDDDARPETEGFDPEDRGLSQFQRGRNRQIEAAWKRGEWRYAGVVLAVERCGVMLDARAAQAFGLDMNLAVGKDRADNGHLTEAANSLLNDALAAGRAKMLDLVRGFRGSHGLACPRCGSPDLTEGRQERGDAS